MIARPPRWLIAAILVDGAILASLIARGFGILPPEEDSTLLICGAFAFAIYAGIALWLWLSPSAHRYGLAMGLYVVGVMIAGSWLGLLALGLGMSSTIGDDDLRIVGSALGLLVAQLVLSVAAYHAAGRAGVESRLEAAGAGVFQLNIAGLLSLFAALGLSIFIDGFLVSRGARGFEALLGAVYRIQGCAAQYAHSHPEIGYPSSLAAMGPGGEKCLDNRTVAGRDSNGVAIAYMPVRDEHERVTSFLVTAIGRGFDPVDTLSGDTSGIARSSGSVEWGKSLYKLSSFRNCLALYRAWFPDQPFPASLADLARTMKGRDDGVVGAPLYGGCRFTASDDGRPEEARVEEIVTMHGEHHLTYRADGNDDYVLEVRPVRYGETAVRSYMMRSNERVHVTLLDRPAKDDDPEVRACEYQENDHRHSCISLPGPPPAAAFIHDTVVVRASPVLLAARDPRDGTSPLDPSLRVYFDCDATSPLDRSLPGEVGPEHERVCPPLPDWRGDSAMVVRLWVMDRSGAIAVHEATMRRVDGPIQATR